MRTGSEPHFSEGFFGVRKWNYIFNFRTGKGNEFITCQYRIVYDATAVVESTHWKEHQCEELVNSAAPRPIVSEHFAVDENVLFAFDRSSQRDILPDGRETLDDILIRLKTVYRSLNSVSIIGHTDRIGSDQYNRDLSLVRAQTVRDYLIAHGPSTNPVTVAGVGNAAPVARNCPAGSTPDAIRCLQPDRRVTIDVVGAKR